jgi:hypothetical protein
MTASQPRNQHHLRRRLRALLLVGSLLLPAFCVMGWLSFLATDWVRWLILGVWLLISALLSLVVARTLKTLALLDQEMHE